MLLEEHLFTVIPDTLSYAEACVLPLGMVSAASGLFEEGYLNLPYPSTEPKGLGKTLLVWGGSSSVGCNAIQLAVAAGCEVVTTCSPRNFGLMKRLGASQVFDYSSDSVVDNIINYLKDKVIAGAFCGKLYNLVIHVPACDTSLIEE